ncbi:hypothetical protein NIES4101_72950 [Calothrix sp. NIES-4101]|nr:hypothetical protein NIES4101_72950 [Calothrix sp. NIES-4101]
MIGNICVNLILLWQHFKTLYTTDRLLEDVLLVLRDRRLGKRDLQALKPQPLSVLITLNPDSPS